MADGDIFINPETGRGEIIGGAAKADQDIADCYLTEYDAARDWGSEINMSSLGTVLSPSEFKALLYMRLSQANQRILSKQGRDSNPTSGEMIQEFIRVEVGFDAEAQNAFFVSIAQLEDGSTVAQGGSTTFRPVSLKHIIPPPADITAKIVKG